MDTNSHAHTLMRARGWFDEGALPIEFVLPDGAHAVDAWDDEEVLEGLGLTALVKSGVYDPKGSVFMWGAAAC